MCFLVNSFVRFDPKLGMGFCVAQKGRNVVVTNFMEKVIEMSPVDDLVKKVLNTCY